MGRTYGQGEKWGQKAQDRTGLKPTNSRTVQVHCFEIPVGLENNPEFTQIPLWTKEE